MTRSLLRAIVFLSLTSTVAGLAACSDDDQLPARADEERVAKPPAEPRE